MSKIVFIVTFITTLLTCLGCLFGVFWSFLNDNVGLGITCAVLAIFFGVFVYDDIKKLIKPQS
jgi:uncharacterized membrane protein YdjX (TVP38/TMEM64 family)